MKGYSFLESQLKLPTPVTPIISDWTSEAGISLYIKQDELIHPQIAGNKWRKLKYSIREACESNTRGVITYGGAYSNHLIAVAAAAQFAGLQSVGIVRSYQAHLDNPTLHRCRSYGMKLIFIAPLEYKLKEDSIVIQQLLESYKNYSLIPEGGTQASALKGVAEIIDEIEKTTIGKVDYYITSIGSGGTMAGIVNRVGAGSKVIGVSPFKGNFDSVAGIELIDSMSLWEVKPSILDIRFGAYDPRIVDYILKFYEEHGIVLDPVYTARAMMSLEEWGSAGYFNSGSTIVFLHTGGLQGLLGFNEQYQKKEKLIPDEMLRASGQL